MSFPVESLSCVSASMTLDGADWQAGYFISESEQQAWTARSRNLHLMLMDSAASAGVVDGSGGEDALYPCAVPGCDRTVLLENGLLEDPYWGRNLEKSSWCEKQSWVFRKRFVLSESLRSCRHVQLRFKGIDYRASFYLNGALLGTHEGVFSEAVFEVSESVRREGENLLSVVFAPAPSGMPNHRDDQPADFAAYARVQYGFGWDWSRSFVPMGIWDSVLIEGWNSLAIRGLHWQTRDCHFTVTGKVMGDDSWLGQATVTLRPLEAQEPVFERQWELAMNAGENSLELAGDFPEARKWYPAGYGQPELYELCLTVGDVSRTLQVGFRDLEMKRTPGSAEDAYPLTFCVNGKEVFVRGANWVPMDLLFSRVHRRDYEELIEHAVTAGFNMFRIWGGGLVEKDSFYDCCDRHGILVWQEFPHACSQYPRSAEYLARQEVVGRAIIGKLRNHVSLALFCGGNEVQYYGERPDSPLYGMYEQLVDELASGIPFHVSSPDKSRSGERPHGPWSYQEHEVYNGHFRQLASELGCNSLPEDFSARRFIPEDEQLPSGQSWRYHFFNTHGGNDLRRPLEKFDLRDNWEWCQASMFAQADAAGYMFEHYRRQWPASSGILFWQFDEPWPTCTWSLVDYYRQPKRAIYRLHQSNASRSFSVRDSSWCLTDGRLQGELWYAGDADGFDGLVELSAWDGHGRRLYVNSLPLKVMRGNHKVCELDVDVAGAGEGVVLLVVRGRDSQGEMRMERLYGVPDFKRAFLLPKAEVHYRLERQEKAFVLTLKNCGAVPALSVCAQGGEGWIWRENYASLAPGETVVYHGICRQNEEGTIRLRGWNLPEGVSLGTP